MPKDTENKVREQENKSIKSNFSDVSNICGGITDEEFADEFLAYPASPNEKGANYQFNFLGAELEKINSAQKVKDELKK